MGDPAARARLIQLAAEPAVPAIARATVLAELQRFPSVASEDAWTKGLADADPLVRIAALRAHAVQPLDIRRRRAVPLLNDPSPAVRLEAAVLLADLSPTGLPQAEREALQAAFAQYEAAQRLNVDRPEGRANLGGFLLRRGRPAEAEAEFLAGLKLEPAATPLHVNLADLYRGQGREAEAEQLLRQAISLAPTAAAPRHALGLALIRQKRYAPAIDQLGQAAALAPEDARYAYVHAVALQSTGQPDQARTAFTAALARHPFDPDLVTLALQDALKSADVSRAAPLAERLAALNPDNPEIARLAGKLNPK
jgi:Flp pilus assembly protein TadD